ncbi:antigen 5 like allergen Cul n 1 [Drosophila ficusphila]|uniref:antigen 5 like allergen Cul n 1 n=1 Tax=Drosophila ficusphila TaxID=30025 RepID=UPI0007E5E493|nr:antigen 5 like allergen Cul n 1 [Drosophila ficusphila]
MSTVLVVALILSGVLQFVYSEDNTTATPTDYCQKDLCHFLKKHIGCRNKGELNKQCPADAYLVNLTGLHDLILDEHNALRNVLAAGKAPKLPQPDRMATLRWHAELEDLATLNVKQCALQYDPCHNTPEFRNSGQNLAIINITLLQGEGNHTDECLIRESIGGWWNQSINITREQLQRFPKGKLGDSIRNFAIMARDNNTFVGCAALRFDKPAGHPQFLLACNYASNYVPDWPIYREKSIGCQSGSDLKYPSLCKAGEQYQELPLEESATVRSGFWRL